MRKLVLQIGPAFVGLCLATTAQSTTTRYEVVDLGQADTASTVCPCFFTQDINNDNQAAGFFFGTDGTYNAFLTEGEQMLDISPPGDNRAFARAINDLGWVAGWTDFFEPQHAFLYDGEDLIDLGTLGGTYSDAHDVSNTGQVVGSASVLPEDVEHAAIWQDGAWTDLGTLGGPFSEARAISESGLIVGWSWNSDWDTRPVFWTTDLAGPFELPTFSEPSLTASAADVNGDDVIVGTVTIGTFEGQPQHRAALWQDGKVVDLGLLPEAGEGTGFFGETAHVSTAARGINDEGIIVGMSFPAAVAPEARPGPFVYRDGTMTNLHDLLQPADQSWIITEVVSINNAGVIGGSGRTPADQHSRAVLLVPVEIATGDLDGDGSVGFSDLVALLSAWGPCPGGCIADLDGDETVGFADLLVLLAAWSG